MAPYAPCLRSSRRETRIPPSAPRPSSGSAPPARGPGDLRGPPRPYHAPPRRRGPSGIACQWEDNVLRIMQPQSLQPRRHFSGRRIDLDWGTRGRAPGRDLREGLTELAAWGGATVVLDPAVRGEVVLKLNQVRWDQAFEIVVRVNGLDWTQNGKILKVFPPSAR